MYIFHLVKDDIFKQYQLVSEATGTPLVVEKSAINIERSVSFQYESLLKLMKDNSGLYIAIGLIQGEAGPTGGIYWKNFIGLQGDDDWGWYQNNQVVQAKPSTFNCPHVDDEKVSWLTDHARSRKRSLKHLGHCFCRQR